ncbi:MAG: hypothetical protein RL608_1317 [Bacteroidota bacterium]
MNFCLKYCTRTLLVLVFAFFSAESLSAQSVGGLRGLVVDASDQSPLNLVQVSLSVGGKRYETFTNNDGFYQINGIAVGAYKLQISRAGFSSQVIDVKVVADKNTFNRVSLKESTVELDDVVVDARKQEKQTKVSTAVVQLNPKSIVTFSIGGEPDLVRALQVMPGVITTGDQGGQLYIRGGAPIQNLVKLDGMILYNPFHSIGFFSVFETDIMQSADVYTAGFGAEYGGRTSSVMDIRTRTGRRDRIAGKVAASTYLAKGLLEIPVGRKNDGIAPSSLLVSYKQSLLDKAAPVFYPYVATEYGGLPFQFRDLYSKYSLESNGGNKFNVFGFNFTDAVRFAGNKSISWNSYGYGTDFTVVPAASNTILEGHLAQSAYTITSTELENRPRFSTINGFNGGLDFTYLLRKADELKYGLEFIGYYTDYQYTNSVGRTLQDEDNTTELGLYFDYKRQQGRWLIQPGIRLHNYATMGLLRIEPRFGAKFNASENVRFKFSGGRYSQNLIAANSDRDVVNLFYGFLSGGGIDLPSKIGNEPVTGRLQTADHLVLGIEFNPAPKWNVELEAYVKRFNMITNVNRYKLYDDNEQYANQPERLRKDFMVERGLARGIDALINYEDKSWYFWGVYSLGRSTRFDGEQTYAPFYDRRHNVNLVLARKLPKSLEFNVRWNYGSGFPFTPIRGYYEQLPFTNPDGSPWIDYPFPTRNGQMGILYGDLNSKRLPDYHRMDITAKKSWDLGEKQHLEASFAVTNVYNRRNIFYYDTPKAQRVNQLPIMPTLLLSYAF